MLQRSLKSQRWEHSISSKPFQVCSNAEALNSFAPALLKGARNTRTSLTHLIIQQRPENNEQVILHFSASNKLVLIEVLDLKWLNSRLDRCCLSCLGVVTMIVAIDAGGVVFAAVGDKSQNGNASVSKGFDRLKHCRTIGASHANC